MNNLLNDLLALNSSVIGYASVPEVLWVAFALVTLIVQAVDLRRAYSDFGAVLEAMRLGLRDASELQGALAVVNDRILSGRLRLVVQVLLALLGLYYAVAVPDGVRPEVKAALFALCIVLAVTEGLLIYIYWHTAETWRRLNREGERDA